jgi:DTW domain-containing protein
VTAERCPRCFGTGARCLCAKLSPITTRTRFVVLQHLLEAKKVSNTARVAALAMTSLELRTWGERADVVSDLSPEGTWLLSPDGQPAPSAVPRLVVALDASWSQARHMVQRSVPLRALTKVRLEPPSVEKSLRDAPPGGLSTLQALAHTVLLLEGQAAAAPVFALHELLVNRTLSARGYL